MKVYGYFLIAALICFISATVPAEGADDAEPYLSRALGFKEYAHYDSAAYYFSLAMEILKRKNNYGGIIQCLNGIAHIALIEGDNERAYQLLEEALETGKENFGNLARENARTYDVLGRFYLDARQPDKAYAHLDTALQIKMDHFGPEHTETGRTYRNIGLVHRYQNEYYEALDLYHKTLNIYLQEYGENHLQTADIYNDIGVVFDYLGDYYTAHRYYSKVLELRRELLDNPHNEIARAYGNLGIISLQRGDYDSALEYFYETLSIQIELFGAEHLENARTYYNLGIVYNNKHDIETALRYLFLGLQVTIDTAGEDYFWIPFYYSTIATSYKRKNDLVKAEEYFREALRINIESFGKSHRDIYLQQSNLGVIYNLRGEHETALEYFEKSLAGSKQIYDRDHPNIARQYSGIGTAYAGLQQYDRAHEYYNRALYALQTRFGDHHPTIARIYQEVGDTYIAVKNYDKALQYYQSALHAIAPGFTDSSATTNPAFDQLLSAVECARILRSKAQAFELRGEMHKAFETYTHLIDFTEKMRIGYLDEGSKIFLASESFEIYERATAIALLLNEETGDRSFIDKAFTITERSKAGILREALNESRARRFAGIPDTLLEREQDLRTDLAYFEIELQKERVDEKTLHQFRTHYYTLKNEYDRLIDTFEQAYPEYYNLKYKTNVLSVAEVQSSLDRNTALLEYLTGANALYLFVITGDTVAVYREPINDAFETTVNDYLRSLRLFGIQSLPGLSHALYTTLLQPAADILSGKEKLVIIPDGPLHHIPFETLITEPYESDVIEFHRPMYLIRNHEVVYHYSAALYISSRHVQTAPFDVATGPENRTFIGFAPVFSDERTGRIVSIHFDESDLPVDTRRSGIIDGSWFSPLPYSEYELCTILELFDRHNKVAKGFFHNEATKNNFLKTSAQAGIVHIASHGFMNEEHPDLSGIVFNIKDENAVDDAILFAGEIYNLELDAGLVVLSSCESGLGEYVRGEGLMAMTRGFLYSGAENVVVSLWKVYDRHTNTLMYEFYNALLNGKSYSAALRQAKLAMISHEESAFPHFWGGFVLFGH